MMRLLTTVLRTLAALAGLLLLALAGVIVVDGLGSGARLDALTTTAIPAAEGREVRAFVARPDGSGPFPAVIMIHEFWGLNGELVEKAEALAAEGYVVVAPDTFRGSTARWVPRAIYQVVTTPTEAVNADLAAVFDWLATQPDVARERVAAMGFCYGGGAALEYSLTNPSLAATAVLYGSPVTEAERLRALSGPVLGIFGGADASIPLDEVRAFEGALAAAGVPHEVTIYDGQPHAFITDMAAVRAGGAPGEAWAQLVRFLDDSLSGAPQGHAPAPPPVASADALAWRYALRLALAHVLGGGGHAAHP